MLVCDCQDELVTPVESALDYYVNLQKEMEMEKGTDDDVQTQQQTTMPTASIGIKPILMAEKTSSIDVFADHKFKVQKIIARPR